MQQQEIFHASSPVTVVKYQQANALLVCATRDGMIYGFDTATEFRPLFQFSSGLTTVDGLDIHPRDKVIALAGQGTHQFWDLPGQRQIFSDSYPLYQQSGSGDGSGFCLRFHHSDWAIFGSYGAGFVARNYKTGELRDLFVGSDSNVCLDFHPSGRLALASLLLPQDSAKIVFFEFLASGDCTLYREPEIEFLDEETETDIPVNAVFAPRGDQLLSSTTNMYIMQSRKEVEEVGALLGFVMSHSFPGCDLIHEVPILGRLGDLTKYEKAGRDGETLYGAGGWLSNLVAIAGGSYGACGTQAGEVVLIDYTEGKVVLQESVHHSQINSVTAAGLHQVITGGDDGFLYLYDFAEEVGTSDGVTDVPQEAASASEREFYRIALTDVHKRE